MTSRTAEHALRAVVYLASREAGHKPIPARSVARALDAPSNYLSKTLNELVRRGILESTPGRRGGFYLARPPEKLMLSDVLDIFDEPGGRPVCLLGGRSCDPGTPCQAHTPWSCIRAAQRAAFTDTTVAELLRSAS